MNTLESDMNVNKLHCQFNMPNALESKLNGDEEYAHGLPPYNPIPAYLVDKYPACPENWMRSKGKLKSYFVPVEEGGGMWLDFNNIEVPYHLAVIVSIQGINAITGLPCKDAHLEQYIEKCPKHNIPFGPDRFCKKCNFKWPKQNYLCTTGTPDRYFWLDGFRSAEGIVRQYILTAEKMRGVASNIIGNDRVYAIGISFFLSRERHERPSVNPRLPLITTTGWTTTYPKWEYYDSITTTPLEDNSNVFGGGTSSTYTNYCCVSNLTKSLTDTKGTYADTKGTYAEQLIPCSTKGQSIGRDILRSVKPIKTKKIEIGAGAKIKQAVCDDPESLDFWKDEPEGIICINYCTEIEVTKILGGGEINLDGNSEGFLQNIPVGN